MKVLLVNGSPHQKGSTYIALSEIAKTLESEGIEAEIFHIGTEPISGCRGCGGCRRAGKCVQSGDILESFLESAQTADGYILGSPVHYASAAGAFTALLDRAFYSASRVFAFKPGAAISVARRAGTTATLDQLNKYFQISNMPTVPSQYWNMVHGARAEDVAQDLEGLQIMRTLARNMAWMLGCIEAGKAAGIEPKRDAEPRVMTNFIR